MDPDRPPRDPNAPKRPRPDPNGPPPDPNAPNREAPAGSAPDRPASDRPSPDRLASNRSAPERITSDHSVREQPAPYRSAPDRPPSGQPSPDRLTPERSAPYRPAPERSASDRPAPERSTPDRPAPERSAPDRSAPGRSRPPSHGVPRKISASPPSGTAGMSQTGLFDSEQEESWLKCLYNSDTGEFCFRTPTSWILIIAYSTMYLIFLSTFTLIILYISLTIIKQTIDFSAFDPIMEQPIYEYLTYSKPRVGLTASPASEDNVPLIWYKHGKEDGYDKYVKAIDKFLWSNRRKREVSSLGPCGQPPYGYGEKPCIIIRINKKFNWAGKPLNFNSTIAKFAPAEVQAWMRADKTKLWLQCSGFHSYDKEHIGKITYYPDPPGFDASQFPLDADKQSPLVAVQISEFTIGISLAIECKLWFDAGPSTVEFVLYVAPEDKIALRSVNA